MKIMISDKLGQDGIDVLEKTEHEIVKAWEIPKDELPKHVADVDALIVRGATKVKGALIDAATSLKVVGRAGVGLDNVDLKVAKERGIVVRNTPAATSVTVAELALTFIMASTRDVVTGTAGLKKDPSSFGKLKKQLASTEVYGKTLGIVAFGRIGHELAKRALALGMNVLAYKRSPPASPPEGISFVAYDELLEKSDYISVHAPLTETTKHMISDAQFGKMKKGVIIVDVSRGGVVDGNALLAALKDGKVRVAALDVFETEPPLEEELLELPNVICTPHIGGQTKEGQNRAAIQVAEAVLEELNKL